MTSQPFRKKENSVWFREEREEQDTQASPITEQDFLALANPNILRNRYCVQWLRRFCQAVCPEVMLFVVRFFRDRVREDNEKIMSEGWLRSGGWKGVMKDLATAEKEILSVYGLTDKDLEG